MREYSKPSVIVHADFAEGVYMASGSPAAQDAISVSATIVGNDGTKQVWFNAHITNNSASDIEGWSANITFDAPVISADASNCNVLVAGQVITVTPAYDWNRVLRANETMTISGSAVGESLLNLV